MISDNPISVTSHNELELDKPTIHNTDKLEEAQSNLERLQESLASDRFCPNTIIIDDISND